MANGTQFDRNEARELVGNIARGHGYIPPETLATIEPGVRRLVVEALRNKDDRIASAVLTLARNLYTSNARFIYELLQNADDNHYSQARAAGDEPYVSFSVYHDMLVMECNEDGFTEENLKALCDIGKSSKSGAQGYIGEKGIGFKSTFMAASKVQIQSGAFSFYFQHHQGDSGMGMITPIWFEPKEDLPSSMTRITLYFYDSEEVEYPQRERNNINRQLWGLQGTILLFLKNLRNIKITEFSRDGNLTRSRKITMVKDVPGGFIQLNNTEYEGTVTIVTSHKFHVTSHLAEGLAKNENRTYTKAEEETKAYSTADVVLAFPLDDKNNPVIEAQELFAFMPVRKIGFNFLIQADFVTQANRQDIVTTSERNIGLRKAIGDAFVKSVLQLCTHPSLQYKWIHYLPRKGFLPLDSFWKDLVPYLSATLCKEPILHPRSDLPGKLCKITELKRFKGRELAQDGNPLFPDLPVEIYLSGAYESRDLDTLGEYGLKYLEMKDILPRIESFVRQPGWKSKLYETRDENWHSRVAGLVLDAWNSLPERADTLRRMPLLPLSSGILQSRLMDANVFFPDIDGISIPQDLNISMILPAAAANADCRKLYKALGVTTADHYKIQTLIVDKHRRWEVRTFENALDFTTSNNHLRYLYQISPKLKLTGPQQDAIVVFDHKGRARHPQEEYVYIPGGDEGSPTRLLQKFPSMDSEEVDVSFIHPVYLLDPPPTPRGSAIDWEGWLFGTIYLETNVQLFSKRSHITDQPKTITKEWAYVVKHWPTQMVTRLLQKWPDNKKFWQPDKIGTKLVCELDVLCVDGTRLPLQNTFLPMPQLLALSGKLLSNPKAIPFLELAAPLEEFDIDDWVVGFGKHFGIGVADDLNFSLAVLRTIIYNKSKTKDSLTQIVLQLYLHIHTQCLASEDRKGAQEKVREFFVANKGILCSPLPSNDPDSNDPKDAAWAFPSKCLWDAPAAMSSANPLRHIWEPVLNTLDSQDQESLAQFFHHTLLIRDVSHEDILAQLGALSGQYEESSAGSPDLVFIRELYQRLDELRRTGESVVKAIKAIFAETRLIYAPSDQPKRWFKVSECVWSSEKDIAGKACLEPLYPELTALFVDNLGVPKLSFALIYQELVQLDSSNASIDGVKSLLWSLKAVLPLETGERPAFADKIAFCPIFPANMPDGNIKLLTARDDFGIVDRQPYADALGSKIKLLDFTLDEVRQLKPLFEWAGLTDRYLSRSVLEQTVVDDELCMENTNLIRNLTRKAGVFVSIATHFESPLISSGPEILYSALKKTKVFTTKAITSTLIITQDGETTVMPIGSSELHIQTAFNDGLEIYVPADEDAQDFCVASKLPRELAAYLLKCKSSTVNPEVVSIVASVIHAKPSNTRRILESNGITQLKFSTHGDDKGNEKDEDELIFQGMVPKIERSNSVTLIPSPDRPANRGNSPYGFANQPRSPTNFQPVRNEQYRALLRQVVDVARNTSFPDQVPIFDMPAILQTIQAVPGSQWSFKFYHGDPAEWRRMVGAAGELFVFEVLSRLQPTLPNFDYSNWQSCVRHHVKVHPDYSLLTNWEGPETDIFYSDESGNFTAMLVKKGYLNENWKGEKPDYFMEVKTTTSYNLETPFYLSREQYKRMQDLSGGSPQNLNPKKQLYVLFRVYGLDSGRIGVKVYVDPEIARKERQLEFEPKEWTVTPRARTRT